MASDRYAYSFSPLDRRPQIERNQDGREQLVCGRISIAAPQARPATAIHRADSGLPIATSANIASASAGKSLSGNDRNPLQRAIVSIARITRRAMPQRQRGQDISASLGASTAPISANVSALTNSAVNDECHPIAVLQTSRK